MRACMLAFARSLPHSFHIKSSSTIIGTDPTVARVRSRRSNNCEQKEREKKKKQEEDEEIRVLDGGEEEIAL